MPQTGSTAVLVAMAASLGVWIVVASVVVVTVASCTSVLPGWAGGGEWLGMPAA